MDLEFIKRIEQRGTAEIAEYPDDALLFVFDALEKIEDLQEALADLVAVQNGPPLVTYIEAWNEAMDKALAALKDGE